VNCKVIKKGIDCKVYCVTFVEWIGGETETERKRIVNRWLLVDRTKKWDGRCGGGKNRTGWIRMANGRAYLRYADNVLYVREWAEK
jgi:hypothetical protein